MCFESSPTVTRTSADDAASRINESAMDFIGDVVLEASGSDYIFIEDYRDDV